MSIRSTSFCTVLCWFSIRRHAASGLINHSCISANLCDEIKEVAVSVRPVCWQPLIAFVEMIDRRMKTLNRKFAETEVRSSGSRVVRCQPQECLFEVTKTSDFSIYNSLRDTLNEGMERLQSLFPEDRLYDKAFNLLACRQSQLTLLRYLSIKCRDRAGDGRLSHPCSSFGRRLRFE